jgi:hypothetical protein
MAVPQSAYLIGGIRPHIEPSRQATWTAWVVPTDRSSSVNSYAGDSAA